jgi:glutathione S-transferase
MVADILRALRRTDLVSSHKVLAPYLARCLERPAYQRALGAHLATFQQAV